MSEKEIESLLKELFGLRYKHSWDNDSSYVISEYQRSTVENCIREWNKELNGIDGVKERVVKELFDFSELERSKIKISELEAKVYMYEQIISKSNFAPMIDFKAKETKLPGGVPDEDHG